MNNYHTLELGGQRRGLKFNFGTLRFIGELTGNDPLLLAQASTPKEIFNQARIIVQAGMMSNYLSLKKEVDFTGEEVADWLSELPINTVMEVVTAFSKSFAGEATDKADTQQ